MEHEVLMRLIDEYAEASWQDGHNGVDDQSQGTRDKRDRIEDLLNPSNLLDLLRSEIQKLEETRDSVLRLSQEIRVRGRHWRSLKPRTMDAFIERVTKKQTNN